MIGRELARLALAAAPGGFAPHRADMDVLREVLERTRAVRTPSGPRLGSYLEALAAALTRWIGRRLGRGGFADDVVLAVKIAALAIVAAAAAFLAVSLWRWVAAHRRAGSVTIPRLDWRTEGRAGPGSLDRGAWRARLEERLAAGDLAGALEALWWWFAASLELEGGVDPSWTTRELLRRARRPELSGAASDLDVLLYGPRAPAAGDVAACLASLERRLA